MDIRRIVFLFSQKTINSLDYFNHYNKHTLPGNLLQTKIGPLLQIKILTVSFLFQLNQYLQIFNT